MTILRRTLFGLAGALVLLACSERREAPTGNGDGPLFAASRDTSTGASHYTANGRRAEVWWSSYDSSGGSGSFANGQLAAQDINDTRNEMVSVYYYANSCDAAGNCEYLYGSGTLPRGVLKGGGSQSLQLEFTPADYPGFSVYVCRWDPALGWICTVSGAGGSVNVTWRANGMASGRRSGTEDYEYAGYYRVHLTGVMTWANAFAQGTVGSTVIGPGSNGSIGTNHNVSLTFQR